MTRSKTRHTRREKQAPISTRSHDKTVAPSRPGGKLGLIVDRLAAKAGATATELAEATGWQKHYADVRIMPTCVGNPG